MSLLSGTAITMQQEIIQAVTPDKTFENSKQFLKYLFEKYDCRMVNRNSKKIQLMYLGNSPEEKQGTFIIPLGEMRYNEIKEVIQIGENVITLTSVSTQDHWELRLVNNNGYGNSLKIGRIV